jgi:CubicO group peptidase (beta-lactamase class C family)
VSRPGTSWDYENYDTLLAVHTLKTALGEKDYREFPRKALLDKIGMRSTVPGVDRFGDYILSSQVYTNARDLARFALLYLNRGKWPNAERRASCPNPGSISVTPAPSTSGAAGSTAVSGGSSPTTARTSPDAYTTAGNRGQHAVVVPSYDPSSCGGARLASGRSLFPEWDLTREVLKAFPKRAWGQKRDRPPTARNP